MIAKTQCRLQIVCSCGYEPSVVRRKHPVMQRYSSVPALRRILSRAPDLDRSGRCRSAQALRLPRDEGLHLLRSFKSHANLDPAFTLRPQDGRAALPVANGEISVRVATGPGVRGEKLALRLLPLALAGPPLDQLGLCAPDLLRVRSCFQLRHARRCVRSSAYQ